MTDRPKFGSSKPGPQGTMPKVGFMPTSPACAAGLRVEPPASVASASAPMPEASAATAPPDDPPGVSARFQGDRVWPYTRLLLTPLQANSEQLVMPRITAPSARSRATGQASAGAMKSSNRREPCVMRRPCTHRLSLTVIGTPARGSASPWARRTSTAAACASVQASSCSITAFSGAFTACRRASASCASSCAPIRRERTAAAASWAVHCQGSVIALLRPQG